MTSLSLQMMPASYQSKNSSVFTFSIMVPTVRDSKSRITRSALSLATRRRILTESPLSGSEGKR